MGCKMCEKPKMRYKKGLWSPYEDQKLRDCILEHGHGSWSSVAIKAGLERNGKSCRLRWINYLRPGLKRGAFTPEEEAVIVKLQALLGSRWSQIAKHLPGRTDNEVKNYWNTYLKKKVVKVDGPPPHSMDTDNDDGRPRMFELRCSQIPLSESSDSLGSDELTMVHAAADSTRAAAATAAADQSPFPRVLFADWLPLLTDVKGCVISPSAMDGGTGCCQQELSTSNSEVISPQLVQSDDMNSSAADGFEESNIFEEMDRIPDATFHDLLPFNEASSYTGFELNNELFINL